MNVRESVIPRYTGIPRMSIARTLGGTNGKPPGDRRVRTEHMSGLHLYPLQFFSPAASEIFTRLSPCPPEG